MKKGRRGGANGAGIARKADRVHRLKHQLRASVAGGKQEKPRDRNRSAITGTYTGFCPWKERPEGGRLPEIDRVLVNEYIECCSNCSSNSSASSTTSRSEGSTEAAASGSGSSALCRACFFGLYIKPRKPCLLRLVREDKPKNCKQESEALADARALRQWRDLNYLKQTAGNETIDVEIRGTQGAPSFGKGQYQQLPFGEVLQRLQDGDSSLYVTTQRIPSDKYGPKAVCGAPLNGSLAGDFPKSPALAGHLVVSQFNIWMGHSYHGSSTGLHHDFHDNFYCLLRGRKEFRLYSPRLCRLLRPQGCMRMTNSPAIHSNGLISYIPCIREDGAHEGAVLRARQIALEETIRELQEELQSTQARLEAAAEAVEHRDAKRALEDKMNQAEAELDECLEATLTAAGEDSGFEDGDSTTSEEGDVSPHSPSNMFHALFVNFEVPSAVVSPALCLSQAPAPRNP
ncbi:hypothetical protein, conserved [Eimeria maxima]|uniref:Cupin-like domain-containing protein n=1 Tax=Eimeria maxima TaxID=5804 RepID=U6M0C9_EIMMA|nr:hypothetical protein, conserved [Eimeria maxima]CDJ56523.1 hypothetical protein, conserved [Eimeria maxima]